MILHLNQKTIPQRELIGGKAKSLMSLTEEGFAVPQAIVLTVDFFAPWLKAIKASEQWQQIEGKLSKASCDALVRLAASMHFNDSQAAELSEQMAALSGDYFAVRSSSPQEDQADLSFAGVYQTALAVPRSAVQQAIKRIFAASFDYRVFSYIKAHQRSIDQMNVALIVQRQIVSDVSGVGFSLNPLNNAFDEVLINACHGLGEALVSGLVTPDSYVYDSATQRILEQRIGDKKIASRLDRAGGIYQLENRQAKQAALSEGQIVEVANLVKACQNYYDRPVDVEWSYQGDHLYLLQCRPITRYFPFFDELLTEAGQNKRFYIDLTMLTQGFAEPMSVLGLELWAKLLKSIKMDLMTPALNGSTPALYGKQYISITAFQKVVGKTAALKFINSYDGNLRKIFDEIDLTKHPFKGKVAGTEHSKTKMLKGAIKMLPSIVRGVFGNYQKAVVKYREMADYILQQTARLTNRGQFSELTNRALFIMNEAMTTAPVLMAGMVSHRKLYKMFQGDDLDKELAAMTMDLTGNPTSEMGYLLLQMAEHADFKSLTSCEAFVKGVTERAFSEEFLGLHDQFIEKYGARGFKEIDVATVRIYEDITLLYETLSQINTVDNQIYQVRRKRDKAYQRLLAVAKTKGIADKFKKVAARMKATYGYREHPKYLIVIIMAKLHDICLEIGENWQSAGRLDQADHIFDLTIKDIDRAQTDSNYNLKAARSNNLAGYITTANWPLVIDSRAKIYRPPLLKKAGDFVGDAIAPGKVVGRAKLLHTPYQKPLLPGDILVAKYTEPSWTPIFSNAAGVIMEIGGPLQHGGIIAREYGIPCVSGMMGIMAILKDGDLIEVDGDHGIVKRLK